MDQIISQVVSILSTVLPIRELESYILSLNITPAQITFLVAIVALIMSLFAFGRAGLRNYSTFRGTDATQSRLDKLELSYADLRNRYSTALSHMEQELKSAQHDVAEMKKIMEIVFQKNPGTAEHVKEQRHRSPTHERISIEDNGIYTRGAPLDVRFSNKVQQEGLQEGYAGYKK